MTTQNTPKKIALITGANRGIGYETARQLGAQGFHVVVAARARDGAEAAVARLRGEQISAEVLQLDVTDPVSIDAAAATLARRHDHLDVLVNNAGVLLDDPAKAPSAQALSVWTQTFQTNLFGVVATTQALLPLLRKAPAARIVNLSSILGSLSLHSDPGSPIYHFKVPAYDASKSALNAWTVHLAWELRDTAIKVNAAHPGSVKTDMNSGGELSVVDGARTSVALALLDARGPSGAFMHFGEHLPW